MEKSSFISTDGNLEHSHKMMKETTSDSKQTRDFIRMRPSEKSEGESQLHEQPKDNRTEIGAASKKQFHIDKAVKFLAKQIGRPSFKEMVPSRKSGADPLAKPGQEHANESSLETPPQDTEKIPEMKKIAKMFDLDYTVVDPRRGELVIPQWMCAFFREDLGLQRLSERLDPDKYRQLTHPDGSVLPHAAGDSTVAINTGRNPQELRQAFKKANAMDVYDSIWIYAELGNVRKRPHEDWMVFDQNLGKYVKPEAHIDVEPVKKITNKVKDKIDNNQILTELNVSSRDLIIDQTLNVGVPSWLINYGVLQEKLAKPEVANVLQRVFPQYFEKTPPMSLRQDASVRNAPTDQSRTFEMVVENIAKEVRNELQSASSQPDNQRSEATLTQDKEQMRSKILIKMRQDMAAKVVSQLQEIFGKVEREVKNEFPDFGSDHWDWDCENLKIRPKICAGEKANKGTGTKNFIEENKLSKLIVCGDDMSDIDMSKSAQQMKSQMQLDDYTFIAVEWPVDMHNVKTPEEANREEQVKKKVSEAATFTVGGMPDLRNIFKQVSMERRRYVLRDYVRGSVGSSLEWPDVEQRKTAVSPRSGDRLKASLDEPASNACQFERKATRKMMGRWWQQMARVPYLEENQVSLQYLVVPPRSGEPLSLPPLAEETDH